MRPTIFSTSVAARSAIGRAVMSAVFCLTLVTFVGFRSGNAQTSSSTQPPSAVSTAGSEWQIQLTGYLWMSGIDAEVKGARGRSAAASYSFTEIIDHLHGVPFMGAAEVRKGRFSVIGDIIYLPVGGNASIRDPAFSGASLNLDTTIGTALGTYRLIEEPTGSLDIGGGLRAYGISTLTSLHAGTLPGRAISTWSSTADPIVMMRGGMAFDNGFGLLGYADVGGFGLGTKLSWQLIGAISYEFSNMIRLDLGYRYLRVEMERANATISIGGPFLATTFRF